ncbi:MAG: hypothetical protein ABFD89_03625 [Bryobacteraceae bacterium]
MPGWNDTFSAADDWTAVAFLEMFWNAYIERIKILTANYRNVEPFGPPPYFGTDTGYPSLNRAHPTAVAAGDLAATTSYTIAYTDPLTVPSSYHFTIALLQKMAALQLAFQNPSGDAGYVLAWAKDTSDTDYPALMTWADMVIATGMNSSGFTRKFPKEFATAGQTEYGMGHDINGDDIAPVAVANGDKARCLFDSVAPAFRAGEVYKRVAGEWVIIEPEDESAEPDTLESNGFILPGDYIGAWIWTEIRDCFNHLRWTTDPGTYDEYGQLATTSWTIWKEGALYDGMVSHELQEFSSTPPAYASAQAAVAANWTGTAEGTSDDSNQFGIYAYAYGQRTMASGVEDAAYAQLWRGKSELHTLISTHAPSEVRLFIYTAIQTRSPSNDPTNKVYDSFGDADIPVAAGGGLVDTWNVAATDPEELSRAVGDTDSLCTWPTVTLEEGVWHDGMRGYEVTGVAWLVKWDVIGGLEYTVDT